MRFFLSPHLLAEVVTYPLPRLNQVFFCPTCAREWGRVEWRVGRPWWPYGVACGPCGDGSFLHSFFPDDRAEKRILLDVLHRCQPLLAYELSLTLSRPSPNFNLGASSWTPYQLLPWNPQPSQGSTSA